MKLLLTIAALSLCFATIAQAQAEKEIDDAVLRSLILSFSRNIQLKPGENFKFGLYTGECCYSLKPVTARVSWSVEPATRAVIDANSGWFSVDKAAPHGSTFTVSANVENGRRILTIQVFVYTLEANPLVGTWRERSEMKCGSNEPVEREARIEELMFGADGTFTVTWRPFELYKDYWGLYKYDLKQGTIKLVVEGGNHVPSKLATEGTLKFSGGQLLLEGIWLGSMISEDKSAACGMVFSRPY